MATVTINDGPAQQVIADAVKQCSVTDSRGRVITLQRPGILAQFRIVEVAGKDSAENRIYMNMILPLIYVTSLAGEPITLPKNKLQLEALVQLLDEDGIEAVHKGVQENWGEPDPDEEKAEVKK